MDTIHGATGDYGSLPAFLVSAKDLVAYYDPHGMLTAFFATMLVIAVLVLGIKRLPLAWGWAWNYTKERAKDLKMRRELEVKIEDELSDAIEERIQIMLDDGLINPTQANKKRKWLGKRLGYTSLVPVKSVKEGIRTRLSLLSWSKVPFPDAAQMPEPLPSSVVTGTKFGSK